MSWINEEYQKLDRSSRALRRFGLTVGLVFLLLGCVLLWRHRGAGWPLISIGTILTAAAGLAPATLKYIHGTWMIFSLALGWIVTRILLTIAFFLVLTPVGLLQRLFGKQALDVALKPDAVSYWQLRTDRCTPPDYDKQF
jgi:hypothetical protein